MLVMAPPIQPLDERFWSKVARSSDDSCWLWSASKDDKGYGMFKFSGRMWKASRMAWLLTNGDPGHLFVCHRCDTPACVNPRHLFLGDQSLNMRDCAAKLRLNFQTGAAQRGRGGKTRGGSEGGTNHTRNGTKTAIDRFASG